MALPVAAVAAQVVKKRPKVSANTQVISVVLATALGVGAFWGVDVLWRTYKRKLRERHALDQGDPANFAIRIAMAFQNDSPFGWGTDEETLFNILEMIPSATMMRKVQQAYRDLEHRNLAVDLRNELTIEEFAIANQIINSKK